MIFWFFGLPGAGKDHIARLFADTFGAAHIDGDDVLTPEEKRALQTHSFTTDMRLIKIDRIIHEAREHLKSHPYVAVADSLPNNASFNRVRETLGGGVVLVHVEAPKDLHHARLNARQGHFFTPDLLVRWIKQHQEAITSPYYTLINDDAPEEELKLRITELFLRITTP